MIDTECMYCMMNEKLKSLMTPLLTLPAVKVYLYTKDSGFPGRCIVALDHHATEIFNIDEETSHAFIKSVGTVAKAVMQASGADKINYGIYGDTMSHLHVHIVPKHKGGLDWGQPFAMNRGESSVEMTPHEIDFWSEKILSLIANRV